MEDWKDIKEYEGIYRVNTNGEVYSIKSNKILKPFYKSHIPNNQYFAVELHNGNKGKIVYIHRIVAETFIPNPDNLPCVNHKDGNKTNNCVNNLEWCTYSENSTHAVQMGLFQKRKLNKLTYDDIVEIKKNLILGDIQYGITALSEKYGVSHWSISDIYHNRRHADIQIPYTFFVCSDIHSAYTPWMQALTNAGFNPNKYSHKIIVCGDLFDRMNESQQVYDFAKDMIAKDKLIYIKGNHESLLMDCVRRGYPLSNDWSNGTVQTIMDLAPNVKQFNVACSVVYDKVKPLIDKTINYFETKNYIFVHSFVPINCDDNLPPYYVRNRKYSKMENWREASAIKWEDARWGDPFDLADRGLLPDKTLVFGHWHCSKGWAKKEHRSQFDDDARFDPFYGDGFIAIDACTAHTGKVNCIVIEDEFLTTQN